MSSIVRAPQLIFLVDSDRLPTSDARKHVEMFPCHYIIPIDMLVGLKDQINVGIFGLCLICAHPLHPKALAPTWSDHLTFKTSLFPYDKQQAIEAMRCLDKVQGRDRPEWPVFLT